MNHRLQTHECLRGGDCGMQADSTLGPRGDKCQLKSTCLSRSRQPPLTAGIIIMLESRPSFARSNDFSKEAKNLNFYITPPPQLLNWLIFVNTKRLKKKKIFRLNIALRLPNCSFCYYDTQQQQEKPIFPHLLHVHR